MKDFKRGYAHAIANIIHQLQINYGSDHTPSAGVSGLPAELVRAWKSKGWSWEELIDAGVDQQDLYVLEHYQKELGLKPVSPSDHNEIHYP